MKRFEDKFERFFKIEPGDTVLDVGACIGDTTFSMAAKTGAKGKTIAVEPNPMNCRFLKENLARFPNVEGIEKAVWKEPGTLQLHVHSTPTGHSLIASRERKGRPVDVPVDTLDRLFGGRRIDFAKIDVRHAEVAVLEGADKFLKTVRKPVVETHSKDQEDRTYPEVMELLRRYDFKKIEFVMETSLVYAWR
jgi:FkbM family methyltransferase